MCIKEGNVGIGTDPDTLLHLYKASVPHIKLTDSATYQGHIALESSSGGIASGTIPGDLFLGANLGRSIRFGEWSEGVNSNINMTIDPSGNVGIGTNTPGAYRLNVNGISNFSGDMNLTSASNIYWNGGDVAISKTGYNLVFKTYSGSSLLERLRIEQNGNVNIGSPSTEGNLIVNGTVTTKEVKVQLDVWADHIFEDNYNLPSLDKVETYIKENKHLPDIPSAKQVEEEGLSMAEMMKKQMQKIEELTLYLIEMKKENEELKRRVTTLENIN